jgi:Recombinase
LQNQLSTETVDKLGLANLESDSRSKNVNKGKPSSVGQVLRGRVKVKANELTKANVNAGKQRIDSSTVEELAKEAQVLHAQGLSYERIAKRWTEAGIPTLKGGRWHKGTIAKMIQRHAGQ